MTKFCLSLHYNGDNTYLFFNGKEIYKFKGYNENVDFPTQFCLGSISNEFSAFESREVSLKGHVYDFQPLTITLINLQLFTKYLRQTLVSM